jgi:5'-3' exonuclease
MRIALIDSDSIVWAQAWLNRDKSDTELFYALDNQVEDILTNTRADKYVGLLKHPTEMEFRRVMFPNYKGNRPSTPDWYKNRKDIIINYLIAEWEFVFTEKGYEVDDAIASIHAALCNDKTWLSKDPDSIPIVCSVDKDMKQIPGWNYNPKTRILSEVNAQEAEHNVAMQVLHGDTTDNVKPMKKGVGPATAAQKLADYDTMSPLAVAYVEYVQEYGKFMGSVRFAENVLQVIMRRDIDYPFKLVDR